MNWPRTILDGIILSLAFNSIVALMWVLKPRAFLKMLPKEIRQAAPKRTREEKRFTLTLYPIYILILVYMIISTHLTGISGFWNLFWTGYIEMFFINMGDFWLLDVWFRAKFLDRIMIPGTENCKAWQTKNWLLTFGIPEHWIGWTLIVCPLFGFVVAKSSEFLF